MKSSRLRFSSTPSFLPWYAAVFSARSTRSLRFGSARAGNSRLMLWCSSCSCCYVKGMRNAALTFTSAYGLYWYTRWKAVLEAISRPALAFILVFPLGIKGVLLAGVASSVCIATMYEAWAAYRHGFSSSVASIRNRIREVHGCFVCVHCPGVRYMHVDSRRGYRRILPVWLHRRCGAGCGVCLAISRARPNSLSLSAR